MYRTEDDRTEDRLFNAPEHIAWPRPGANLRGPIRDLGRFYEMLLAGGELGGVRLLKPETIARFTGRQRVGMRDDTFQRVLDWGLGFVPDNNCYGSEAASYGYGLHCSPRTYGHGGSQSSVGCADPEHGIVVALFFNGRPGEKKHHRRIQDVLSAIYSDLGVERDA
jgi:CubicO group peptidase (beta-lactamase class C family)